MTALFNHLENFIQFSLYTFQGLVIILSSVMDILAYVRIYVSTNVRIMECLKYRIQDIHMYLRTYMYNNYTHYTKVLSVIVCSVISM